MKGIDNVQTDEWSVSLEQTALLSDFLLSLATKAEERDQLAKIPDIGVTIHENPIQIRSLSKYLFYAGLPRIKFIEKDEMTPEIAEEVLSLLKDVSGDVARGFERLTAELVANNKK